MYKLILIFAFSIFIILKKIEINLFYNRQKLKCFHFYRRKIGFKLTNIYINRLYVNYFFNLVNNFD